MDVGFLLGSDWKLTFDDEFNGDSLDQTKWTPNWVDGVPTQIQAPIQPEHEKSAYDPAQVTVSGGVLHLTGVKKTVRADDGNNYNYATGVMNSRGKFMQTYGYFEARIFVPGVNHNVANWPAFWLLGHDSENDIFEGLGGGAQFHIHIPGVPVKGEVAGNWNGWHTFGALWQAGVVKYYYDDVFVGQIKTNVGSLPEFMILGNSLGGFNAPQLVPSDLKVDWVHVYSNSAGAQAVDPQDGYTGPGDLFPRNLVGGSGNDPLTGGNGNDTLSGGPGNDVLTGAIGHDVMTGGPGADVFDFNNRYDSPAGANRDVIMDFSHAQHDKIDLSDIDANTLIDNDQAFKFIGSQKFHHKAGELRFQNHVLKGDLNGDGKPDFEIAVHGANHLVASDFIL